MPRVRKPASPFRYLAAELLTDPAERTGIHFVEGPDRYSSTDVAKAFADALGRSVTPAVTPRDQWETAYRELGFSEPAVRSYARTTGISVHGDFEMPDDPRPRHAKHLHRRSPIFCAQSLTDL